MVALARGGRRGEPPARFFAAEYRLDHLTAVLRVPYVALLNGVTMGGGCGVSLHGETSGGDGPTTFGCAVLQSCFSRFPTLFFSRFHCIYILLFPFFSRLCVH